MGKIVVIGGGTGRFTLLQGLKNYGHEITAIVSMMDSGGSTGRLRDEYGVLPMGDLTKTAVALSESEDELRELFEYRFKGGKSKGGNEGGLEGHKLGNLILMALNGITEDFEQAVEMMGSILKIKGKVVPITIEPSHLVAELENGQMVFGETNIDVPKHDGNLRIKRLSLDKIVPATESAITAIREADLIVLGPGDLFTSVISNLLVGGIPGAINSSKAKKVFACNLMTKFGETTDFTASMHVKEIEKYLGEKIDSIIVNSNHPCKALLDKYALENSIPVACDLQNLGGYAVFEGDFASDSNELIRHDSKKIAGVVAHLLD